MEVNEDPTRRFLAALDRAERGRQTVMANPLSKDNTDDDHGNSGTTASPIPPTHKLISADDKLAVFRQLTGINTDAALKLPAKDKLTLFRWPIRINSDPAPESIETGRPASNLGIYARAARAEDQAKLLYRRFSLLINACLGIQIIVAAALTALGAGNGPHRVVTGFGAINTIIAGFLTYLKGSGLPNRYKHQQNQWGKVREYIEQRERDFYLVECAFEVNEEIDIIERMYKDVRSETKSSMPDSYVSRKRWQEKKPGEERTPSPTHVSKQKDVLV